MIRIATAIALLALTAGANAQQLAFSTPVTPTLRGDIMVSSDVVRIGDLLENAGPSASVAVFRAPDLGTTGSVPAARVLEALRAQHIIGVDTRGIEEINVTRASRAIGTKEIESRIALVLASRYGLRNADNLSVTFDRDIRTIHIDINQSADFPVTRLSFEPRSGRFDVVFDVSTGSTSNKTSMRFTGTAIETVETLTTTRLIARNEVLREQDLVIERRPKTEVAADGLNDVQSAIGMAARQAMRPGQVIRKTDLSKPELVQRNETVIMVFEQPGLTLTLRGKSLDSGSEGDTVNVTNLQTKRTMQGVVTGQNQVTIMSTVARATTNVAAINNPGAVARP